MTLLYQVLPNAQLNNDESVGTPYRGNLSLFLEIQKMRQMTCTVVMDSYIGKGLCSNAVVKVTCSFGIFKLLYGLATVILMCHYGKMFCVIQFSFICVIEIGQITIHVVKPK